MRGKCAEKSQAIRLRLEDGLSFSEISAQLNVSKGTLSAWLSGMNISELQKQAIVARSAARMGTALFAGAEANKIKGRNQRNLYREEGRQAAMLGSMSHQMGCALYWAEGGKSKNTVSFVNGDPVMIRAFSKFLFGTGVGANPNRACFSVDCYLDILTLAEIEEFWFEQIGFDLRTTKHRVKPDKPIRLAYSHRKRPHGICRLTLNDTRAVQHIYGALEVYAGVCIDPSR